jgi:glycosyltransferase involved in cell wall biosynthesis
VSIVTPSLNQGRFIEQTVRSVLLQGYADIEYRVIDGGSVDGTLGVIERYGPWLTSWVSARDDGQSDAINRGLAAATGDVVGWLNSDDFLARDALRIVTTALGRCGAEAGAVVGAGHLLDEGGRIIYSPLPSAVTRETLLDWCSGMNFLQPACFFTKAAWVDAGPLRPDLDYCMDLDLWLRIAETHAFVVVNDTLAFARAHDDAKTVRWQHRMFGEIALLLAARGAWPQARHLLYSVLDADDARKRGVRHLAKALLRESVRALRAWPKARRR